MPQIHVGDRFGRLIVTKVERGNKRVFCRCDCGTEKWIVRTLLKGGKVVSCKCFWRERIKAAQLIHGLTKSSEYRTWSLLKIRCSVPSHPDFKNYGGRGIKVCPQWASPAGFVVFWHDMGPKPTPTHTIERRDVNGDYSPENCYWTERVNQNRNRRNVVLYPFQGGMYNARELAPMVGLKYGTLMQRLKRSKMSFDEAISAPVRKWPSHRVTICRT